MHSSIECRFAFSDDLWDVYVDIIQIRQVLQNFIINACQSMQENGTLEFNVINTIVDSESSLTVQPGKYVKITVTDYGIGIPEENIDKIFHHYFTTKQAGSGIGLSMAYFLVDQHDGCITVESEMGVGTSFHVYLPKL